MGESDDITRIRGLLSHFFKPKPVDTDDDDGDDTKKLDCWELKDPSKIKCWTLVWAPHTDHLTLSTSFVGNVPDQVVVDHTVKATDFDYGRDLITLNLICSTTNPKPYNFIVAVDTVKTPFEVLDMVDSLEASNFDEIKSTLKSEVTKNQWKTKEGHALRAKSLSFKLRHVVQALASAAIEARARITPHRPALEGSGLTATGSQPTSRTTTRVQPATPRPAATGRTSEGSPASSTPGRKRAASTKKVEPTKKKNKLLSAEDLAFSLNDAIERVPKAVDKVEDIDWDNSNLVYQKFFSDCQDAFVFEDKPSQKLEIDTMMMENAPVDWTIRAFEPKGETYHINLLINMSDRSNKQTLCVMPDLKVKPTSEAELTKCKFWIINGQHSIVASKKLIMNPDVPETMKKDFRTWNAFVVWTEDIDKLRKISAFYNRVNHFTPFKPTWATNILAARTVWERYGCPPNRHGAAGVADSRVKAKRVANQHAQWDKFLKAITERFAMIDVVKHQKELSKKGKKIVTLTNELKIITFPQELWNLWELVISSTAQGDLIDPDDPSLIKYKNKENFKPDNELILNREFFKFLGNLSERDHEKLCNHILHRDGPSRNQMWPKVVLKQPTTVREDCYSVKDYVERLKRKACAQLQLHKIKPELGICKNDVFVPAAWKKFKKDYHVTKASMRALLEWGVPEKYYKDQRATMHRNRTCNELSPYAKQFFRVFLRVRESFQPSTAILNTRIFIRRTPMSLRPWSEDDWDADGVEANLGIIDFRLLPGSASRANSSKEQPFFQEFMKIFTSQTQPSLTSLPCWLFICGDETDYEQVEEFVCNPDYFPNAPYDLFTSEYVPAINERLGGLPAKSKQALQHVKLLFLIKPSVKLANRPKDFYIAPNHTLYEATRMYNESEYSMYQNELRMEFYLEIMRMFCVKDESVFLLYTGAKSVVASVMLNLKTFAIADIDDTEELQKAWEQGTNLDAADFSINGYPVDSEIYPLVGKAFSKAKEKVEDIEEEDDDDDDYLTGTEEIDSSAEEFHGEGSGTAGDPDAIDLSPRQINFGLLPIEDLSLGDDPRRASQESHTPSGRSGGRGSRGGRKRKGGPVAKESPTTRFKAEAAEKIDFLQQQVAEEKAARKRMEEEFRQRELQRDEENRRQHREMMAMLAQALCGKMCGIPAVPLQTALPSTHFGDAGAAHASETLSPSPTTAIVPQTGMTEPQPRTSMPPSSNIQPEGDDQEHSSDVNVDNLAIDLPATEDVFMVVPVHRETVPLTTIKPIDREAPIPRTDPTLTVDVDRTQLSLGSMGIRDGPEDSNDENQGKCRASLDSLMNAEDYGPSLRSRGLLLQSAATAQSTMDYSTMAVDHGVVNSPVTRKSLCEMEKSPLPVWPDSINHISPTKNGRTPTKRVLYENKVHHAIDKHLRYRVAKVEWFHNVVHADGTPEKEQLDKSVRTAADLVNAFISRALEIARSDRRLYDLLNRIKGMPSVSEPEKFSFWVANLMHPSTRERLQYLRMTDTHERLSREIIGLRAMPLDRASCIQ